MKREPQTSHTAHPSAVQVPGAPIARNGRMWMVNLLVAVILLLCAVASHWLEPRFLPGIPMVVWTGLAFMFALLPPFLWLILFYRLDLADPEPRVNVFKATMLGLLVHLAVCIPIQSRFPFWTSLSGWPQTLPDALGVQFTSAMPMASLLLVLRWGVFPMRSFNERSDGIVYGAAVGLGFAAAANLSWAAGSGDLLLSAAVPRMVVASLVQASLGGLGGYWFGMSVFSRQPLWRQGFRFVLLFLLSGGFAVLPQAVARQGFQFRHLITLVPPLVGALGIFLYLLLLLRAAPTGRLARHALASSRREGVMVGALLVLMLAGAFGLRAWQTRLIRVMPTPALMVSVPANWQRITDAESVYTAGDRFTNGRQTGRIRVLLLENAASQTGFASDMAELQPDGEARIRQLVAWWTIRTARASDWWKPVRTEFLYRDGRWLAVVDSLQVVDAGTGAVGGAPTLRQGRDVLWLEGEDVCQVSIHAVRQDGTADESLMASMVAALRFLPETGEGGGTP